MSPTLTRRAALVGALASSATLAVPATASVADKKPANLPDLPPAARVILDAARDWRSARIHEDELFRRVDPRDVPSPLVRADGSNTGPSWEDYWRSNKATSEAAETLLQTIWRELAQPDA